MAIMLSQKLAERYNDNMDDDGSEMQAATVGRSTSSDQEVDAL